MRNRPENHRTLRVALLPALLAGLLTACGGGGTTGQVVTGKVMDGYLSGATVCYDANSNGSCDSDEPQATSTAGGVYSFSVGSDVDLSSGRIVVDVPATAIDEDTDTAVGQAYKMKGFLGSPAVVSPLTTLIAAYMDADTSLSLEAASAAVRTDLGMASVDLLGDYVGAQEVKVHNVARLLAKNLQAAGTSSPAQLKAALPNLRTGIAEAFSSSIALQDAELESLVASQPSASNLVTNGTFESGTTGWTAAHGTADVREEGGNQYFFADVGVAGDPWNVGITNVLSLTKDVKYKLTFTASTGTDQSRVLRAGIGLNEGDYTSQTVDVVLSPTAQTFELILTSPVTSTNGRVLFDMGHDVGVVVIDNVTLISQ